MMIDQKLVGHFAALIGYLNIAINLNSYSRVRNEYKSVLDELLGWVKCYYENTNLNISPIGMCISVRKEIILNM